MDDVSILLNLTGRIVFEQTDPLMNLVCGHGPYIFYDQLSLKRLPITKEEQEKHVILLLNGLRSLLENRRLSTEDKGGKIRLHILLDLVDSPLTDSGQSYFFPAQKVRHFKEMLRNVFEPDLQLLERFYFTFIFLECDTDDQFFRNFYRGQAYKGFGDFLDQWLSTEMLSFNEVRDKWIDGLHSPEEEKLLSDSSIQAENTAFFSCLNELVIKIANFLKKAGVDVEFRENIAAACERLKTIGDIKNCDFDNLLCSEVSKLIGLSHASNVDSSFFIFKHQTGTEILSRSGEMVLSSLLQLTGTIDDNLYPSVMGLTPNSNPKLFVVDAQSNVSNLDHHALSHLKEYVVNCLSKFGDGGSLRWTKDKSFTYREFSAKNTDPTESNDYKNLNEELRKERNSLFDAFQRLRRIPFFFGGKPGDWEWYNEVSALLGNIYSFESEHERPLYSSIHRISEKEMNVKECKLNFAELKAQRDKYLNGSKYSSGKCINECAGNPMSDLKNYLVEREKALIKFGELKEELKKQMVKLGFASTTCRMSFFSGLLVTLCYSFHFFYTSFAESPIWIAAAIVAVCLILSLAALIAWACVKSSISDIFDKIHTCLAVDIQKKQETYMKSINDSISRQNEADIRKKNLDELNEKISEFERHNMQVDVWENHFESMNDKLTNMLNYLGDTIVNDENGKTSVDDSEIHVEYMPSLPEVVRQHFRKEELNFSTNQHFNNVICFLTRLDVTFFQ